MSWSSIDSHSVTQKRFQLSQRLPSTTWRTFRIPVYTGPTYKNVNKMSRNWISMFSFKKRSTFRSSAQCYQHLPGIYIEQFKDYNAKKWCFTNQSSRSMPSRFTRQRDCGAILSTYVSIPTASPR